MFFHHLDAKPYKNTAILHISAKTQQKVLVFSAISAIFNFFHTMASVGPANPNSKKAKIAVFLYVF